ncbi:MAG TPA: CoA transferase [Burkholderiales bacterium]|nr:CoA transferase [Burkholderiales bacterium]
MKLEGLRVVDLSLFLPGPYLTLALADHGAEVIKVEPPGDGDPTRHLGPADGGCTVYFRSFNRGKKSVVLDLKKPEEREALLALCDGADVFVESFRPGVVERLGISYEQVSARNPRIVYCSISAFGRDGPYRDRPAHDLAVEALAGTLSMTLGGDGKPTIPGLPLADLLASLQGLAGILMALLRRERTGRGDYVEIAMHDALLAGSANILGPTLAENRQPVPRHERTTGGSAFYRLYETADGRALALGGQEMKFVRNLLSALGRPELAPLCERPGPHQQPVMEFLEGVFRAKTLRECLDFLSPLDVCYAPVNTLPEALADPGAAARGALLTDEKGRRHLAPPIRFRDEPARPSLREPALGADNALAKKKP